MIRMRLDSFFLFFFRILSNVWTPVFPLKSTKQINWDVQKKETKQRQIRDRTVTNKRLKKNN
jgi:hypothetical protein